MNKNLRAVLHFPLTKIIVGIIVVIASTYGAQLLMESIFKAVNMPLQFSRIIRGIITSCTALVAYALLYRYYEKRKITELSARGLSFNIGVGMLLGALLQSLTIMVIWIAGGFDVISINPIIYLISPFLMAFTSAIFEEVLVRGIIFRILEEKLGTYISLILSAIIFGALHLGNPNSSLLAATGLALQAGLFLAAAFVFTRNLWFPIAIHFAWNFTQGGIYGASVSGGKVSKSLLNTSITGETWITGGDFGPEGSLQATVFCLTAALILIYISKKKGLIIAPYWKTKT